MVLRDKSNQKRAYLRERWGVGAVAERGGSAYQRAMKALRVIGGFVRKASGKTAAPSSGGVSGG